ncbi:MAG TPA: hypothetical protein VF119_06020 [Candidatus Limnocylindrales bacterium]
MEVIAPTRTERPAIVPVIGGTVVATVFIVLGVVLAWAVFATPLLQAVMPSGRAETGQMFVGMLVWAVALVAPAGLLLVGANRLARILGRARDRMPRRTSLMRIVDGLPEDTVVATGLTLPDGRGLSGLVVGPFGAAVLRELPPPTATRLRNGHWEIHTARGWTAVDDPLERATRDAERVRRWLAHDDVDFVVKTYAAIVGEGVTVPRTSACAVLTPDQVVAWIAALPPQRSLTGGRREAILEMVRDAAR